MALEKFLKNLGLEESDQKVYVALLKLADAPASLIAKKADIKRTTAYSVLEKLKTKGLVSSYVERGTRHFSAESPARLKDFLEAQILALEKYLPQLQSFYNLAKRNTVLSLFEGEEGVKQISEDVLKCKGKTICSLGSIKNMKEAIGTSIRFTQRRVAKKIFEKALRIRKEFEDKYFQEKYVKKQKEEYKEVRFLPEGLEIPALVLIYNNKTGIICSSEEGTGFIIESEDFSRTMKLIFEALWGISKPASL